MKVRTPDSKRLKLKEGIKDRARNTYNTFRGKMDRLKALEKANTELERLQSAKVRQFIIGPVMHI